MQAFQQFQAGSIEYDTVPAVQVAGALVLLGGTPARQVARRHLDQTGRRQADQAALAQAVEQGAVFQAWRGCRRHPVFARRQHRAAQLAPGREGGHQRG